MGLRMKLNLDDDVVARVKRQSLSRGTPFDDTLNDLLRAALLDTGISGEARRVEIKPAHMGQETGLNYDSTEPLLEFWRGRAAQMTRVRADPR
jgi:hypothetical protein